MICLNDVITALGIIVLVIGAILGIGTIWSGYSFQKWDEQNRKNIGEADDEIRKQMGEELARHYF